MACNLHCPPEATAPFFVSFPVSNLVGVEKTKERYDGFCIQGEGDIRWFLEDSEIEWYSVCVWRNDCLLARIPAFEYSLLYNKDEIDQSTHVSNEVTDSMDDARHYYEENKEHHMWQYCLIEFPPGVSLSLKAIFADAGKNDELDY